MNRCPLDEKSAPPLKLTSTDTRPLLVVAGVTHDTSVDDTERPFPSSCPAPKRQVTPSPRKSRPLT